MLWCLVPKHRTFCKPVNPLKQRGQRPGHRVRHPPSSSPRDWHSGTYGQKYQWTIIRDRTRKASKSRHTTLIEGAKVT
jgi:hypothetical protein